MDLKRLRLLKGLIPCAAALGCTLYIILFTAGLDNRGLPVLSHWSCCGLWGLAAAVGTVTVIFTRSLPRLPEKATDYHSASKSAGAGCLIAALACFAFGTPTAQYGLAATADMVLRGIAGAVLCILALCRFRGRRPSFLLHGYLCLYLAFRLINQYRFWSADPQIIQYCFYIGGYITLTLACYHFAALDAGCGNPKKLWRWTAVAAYLCLLTFAGPQELLFMPAMGIWMITNLPLGTEKNAAPEEVSHE